jgi:drug/metabolite transporter (DMT)-like permease
MTTSTLPVENRAAGIGWMLATMFCFLTLDAIMKYGMQSYSLVQVTWARFFFATIVAALFCGRDLPRLLKSSAPVKQGWRTLLLMITTGLFNAGIAHVPLATATVIMSLTPVVVTVLSIFVLHELVGIRRWLGIALGFVGAMLVVKPWEMGTDAFQSATLFLLLAVTTNAGYQIVTRQVRGDNPLTSLVFTALGGAIFSSLIVPWFWIWPDAKGWALLVGSGVAAALGHLCIIKAYASAPASVIAPFNYSSMIWAALFGYLIWNDWPTANVWSGAVLIVAAGLYIFFREIKLARQRD